MSLQSKTNMKVDLLNQLDEQNALEALLKCCGSRRWAELMLASRPFKNEDSLDGEVTKTFAKLDRSDWLEAFAAHPKIGDVDSLRKKYGDTKDWAKSEQSGVNGTSQDVLERLSIGNEKYEETFGFIFIVCATGKSASEMLELLELRLGNSPERELKIAALEQEKITRLRLQKL